MAPFRNKALKRFNNSTPQSTSAHTTIEPPTPIQTNNSTAESIINSRVQPKRTKAMDMRFHWLHDRSINQNQFRFFWRPGHPNLADYWTKHHPASHHCIMRHEFFTPFQYILNLRQLANQ
eukprot:CCRYP_004760-RA/>CCRYP_004760-RA protein AED:0.46 eAED:0.46 QI:0/0/0/1/0/0/2/0/119